MSTTDQLQERSAAVVHTLRDHTPNQRQVVGFVTLTTAGLGLLVLGGLGLAVTALVAALLLPLLVVFSPVLIPLVTVLFLGTAGVLSVGGFALVSFSAVSWLFNYFNGRHPPGSNQVNAARSRIVDTAAHLKERARDYSNNVQEYLHSAKQSLPAAPGA